MKKEFSLSIVIPAFNEALAISEVLAGLKEQLSKVVFPYEVIVVNDFSTDKTGEIVADFSWDNLRLINNDRNLGYGGSIKTGAGEAKYNYIGLIDADGQHKPEDLIRLVEFAGDYDMVVGARQKGSHRAWVRRPGLAFIRALANYLVGYKIPDLNSGLRIIDRGNFLRFKGLFSNSFSLSTTSTLAFFQAGLKTKYVPIVVNKRLGKSTVKQGIHGLTTILLILRVIMVFNPLKIFAPISAFLLVFGLLFSVYGIVFYHGLPNTGVVVILTSIILFLNGLLADQIAAIRRDN